MAKMQILEFLSFQPQTDKQTPCKCGQEGVELCGAIDPKIKKNYFEIDIDDIANSIMKVMAVCRLNLWEVRRCKELIKRAFRNYEEVRYRIERVPRKRFNKENFMNDLALEAGMNRMDSQLAYSITKRAFRAYYHGTGEGGKRSERFAKQLRHRSECMWLHAAKRTAEIFAMITGLLSSEQLEYEECFECIYKTLYDELKTRLIEEDPYMIQCVCMPKTKSRTKKRTEKMEFDAISVTTNFSVGTVVDEIFFNQNPIKSSDPTAATSQIVELTASIKQNLSISSKITKVSNQSAPHNPNRMKRLVKKAKKRIVKCKCPGMECNRHERAPIISAECSQGPYICRWIPYQEEDLPVHYAPCPPMDVICPVCDPIDRSCDSECTCTCQFCQCQPAFGMDYVEEEHNERVSRTGVEDHDTDYCYLAPFFTGPRKEVPVEEEEAEPEDTNPCRCTCIYKQRNQPHLFTYLAPFKSVKEKEKVEEIPPPEKPRMPPYGVSMATYLCWNAPSGTSEQPSDPPCRECPYITLLSNQREETPRKVAGITMDVKVKSQHYPTPDSPAGRSQQQQPKGAGTSKAAKSPIVDRSIVSELGSNLNAMQNEKKQPAPNKPAAPAPLPAQSAAKPAPAAPAPAPATAPATAPAPAPGPNSANAEEDTLTKEDILQMLGLQKYR